MRADEQRQLATVQLGDEYFSVAGQQTAEVAWKRVQVTQVRMGDGVAPCAALADGGRDGAAGAAPAQHQEVGFIRNVGRLLSHELGDELHLVGAQSAHVFVVLGLVAHIARLVLLLQTAEAMLETRCAGHGPGARQCRLVAAVG